MKQPTIINLTPHDVHVLLGPSCAVFSQTGNIARVVQTLEHVTNLNLMEDKVCIPVHRVKYGAVDGLPEPKDNVVYIVSAIVKNAVPNRKDLLSPGEVVRDKQGNIIGCNGFFC